VLLRVPVDNRIAPRLSRDTLSLMTRTPLLRPTLLPGLARVWRDPHTLQLGLDPARAVLIEMPDPGAARILDLLDGTRPERLVLAHAIADGLSPDDAITLIDLLHATGFVLPAPSLLPSSLPDAARHRLSSEAAALALRQCSGVPSPRPSSARTAGLAEAAGVERPFLPTAPKSHRKPSAAEDQAGPETTTGTARAATASARTAPSGTAETQAAGTAETEAAGTAKMAADPGTAPGAGTRATATERAEATATERPEAPTAERAGGPSAGRAGPATAERAGTAAAGPAGTAATEQATKSGAGTTAAGAKAGPAATATETASATASPAQILRRRLGARVVISGRGRLAAPVAVTLAEAGVGHVDPDVPGAVTAAELPGSPLRAADVGRPRAEAIAESVLAAAPETETHSVRRGGASLIVQLGFEQPVALLAASHVARRQAHLAVTIRDGSVLIGPLVRPTGKPCLNCVELHRRDRDAGWPTPGVTPGNAVEPCTVATLLAATAFAAGEVLEFLDGGTPQTLGAAVEISGPGRFRRRTWPPHPGCACAGRPRRSAQTVKHMARLGADQADPGGSMPHRRSQ
jgi:hypothetical protein